jgi:GNAT superfamily N-acetyltransferase
VIIAGMPAYAEPERWLPLQTSEVDEPTVSRFGALLLTLTSRDYDPAVVAANLHEATSSPTTAVFVKRDEINGSVVSTATVNYCETLDRRPRLSWIDDVVTLDPYQGRGLSTQVMGRAEAHAAGFGPVVQLTSAPERGTAEWYGNHGYTLITPREGGVWRKQLGDGAARTENGSSTRVTNLNAENVTAIDRVLPGRAELAGRLQGVVESPSSALFVATKTSGDVAAIALAHLCPIPVGHKPWISLPYVAAGAQEAAEQVVGDAEQLVRGVHPSANFFIVPSGTDSLTAYASRGYKLRETGLFIKDLDQARQ